MTDPNEDELRRAFDDLLATCWADEIPLLDALAAAVTDWTAQVEAEFNESKVFEPGPHSHELAEALAAMAAAADKLRGTTTGWVFTVALAEALRDWSATSATQLDATSTDQLLSPDDTGRINVLDKRVM